MQVNFNKFCIFAVRMKKEAPKSEWFEEWFNTPYYHILYKNRNHHEAEVFVSNLVCRLDIKAEDHVLDLACGKGRHSIFLNKLGLQVTGADLSSNSICEAREAENERLHFIRHDMREVIPNAKFDFVVNLFTSFGYFDDQADNLKVLNSIHEMLTPEGKLVIDFFNLEHVVREMKAEETKTIDGIDFHIFKRFDGKHIYKTITFTHQGQEHSHTERVQGLAAADFEKLLQLSGFRIEDTFGDFQLNPFDNEQSDRFILIATKNA